MVQLNTLLAWACFSLGAQAVSGFGKTCNSWQITDVRRPHILHANCAMPSGVYNVGTQLVLNLCLANDNGRLVHRANGGWDGSCNISGWNPDQFTGTVMHASCKNNAGQYVSTSIDLSESPSTLVNTPTAHNDEKDNFVGNLNGNLAC
ncbi:hypothetical protein PENCOP_c002G06025 [Penicillium coprophilum]|uniref:Cyanovirin-N domain-containing protein n=1 Tax=Penicillium coprophilum TaxID=36646 RepID=A0A1V6V3E6_9EURO|nr:hypothetical protein PENCOP_c002G06025 [Penicillium coprophilum]